VPQIASHKSGNHLAVDQKVKFSEKLDLHFLGGGNIPIETLLKRIVTSKTMSKKKNVDLSRIQFSNPCVLY